MYFYLYVNLIEALYFKNDEQNSVRETKRGASERRYA